jgi:predicted PurR-regulated permease PerM
MNSIFQKTSTILFVGIILIFAKGLLIPIAYSFFIALVIYPITSYLEKKKFGLFLSILIPLLIICLIFSGLITLLTYEALILASKWPLLQEKLNSVWVDIQRELEKDFGWSTVTQLDWIKENLQKITSNIGFIIQQTFRVTFEALFNLIIIPIYVSLILIYRKKLVAFVSDIAPDKYKEKIPAVIKKTVSMYSRFIRGMITVYLSVGILNSLGLFLLGVENALFYGMISAFMTIIPYFGIMISALLPISVSWLNTGSAIQPLGVIGVFTIVQYIEANLIFPYIVGKQVNINTLAAILTIFIGSLFWGVAGMILFIPFVAMFRIFAEEFTELKPWADFLGNK